MRRGGSDGGAISDSRLAVAGVAASSVQVVFALATLYIPLWLQSRTAP